MPTILALQPMDLNCTHQVRRDPHQGLCFNCGKPGHITRVCPEPHTHRIQNVKSGPTLKPTPEDLQVLIDMIKASTALSIPLSLELQGEKEVVESQDFWKNNL